MVAKTKNPSGGVQAAAIKALVDHGFRCQVVPASRLGELIGEIRARSENGELDKDFKKIELDRYIEPTYPDRFPAPRSLFIIAKAVPQIRVVFEWHGHPHEVLIPPTYIETDPPANQVLDRVLGSAGYKVAWARVPFKLLAARAGLSRYGRNNIAYFEGLGSFARLNGWWSDMPPETDPWQEPAVLPECAGCKACQNNCPTGAITSDRFLVHAERCLTYFNESEQAFPSWLQPSWHNALVGCLRCQLCCPANKHVKAWIEAGETFSEKETGLLLECPEPAAIPPATLEKMARMGMDGYTTFLGRNLRVLLDR
jgi:epoxyqueuosine reductase